MVIPHCKFKFQFKDPVHQAAIFLMKALVSQMTCSAWPRLWIPFLTILIGKHLFFKDRWEWGLSISVTSDHAPAPLRGCVHPVTDITVHQYIAPETIFPHCLLASAVMWVIHTLKRSHPALLGHEVSARISKLFARFSWMCQQHTLSHISILGIWKHWHLPQRRQEIHTGQLWTCSEVQGSTGRPGPCSWVVGCVGNFKSFWWVLVLKIYPIWHLTLKYLCVDYADPIDTNRAAIRQGWRPCEGPTARLPSHQTNPPTAAAVE